jgi:hypothetical protein
MLKKITASICALVVLSSYCYAQQSVYDLGHKSRKNSAIRSVVLPGWGQYNNGQKLKGYVMGTTILLSLGATYLLYTKANKTYDDYEQLGLKSSSLYDDYQAQSNQAMVASIFCAGLWVWNIIDAYIYEDEPTQSANSRSGLSVASVGGQTVLAFTKKF